MDDFAPSCMTATGRSPTEGLEREWLDRRRSQFDSLQTIAVVNPSGCPHGRVTFRGKHCNWRDRTSAGYRRHTMTDAQSLSPRDSRVSPAWHLVLNRQHQRTVGSSLCLRRLLTSTLSSGFGTDCQPSPSSASRSIGSRPTAAFPLPECQRAVVFRQACPAATTDSETSPRPPWCPCPGLWEPPRYPSQ